MTKIDTTNHASQRMSQRGLTQSDIELIMSLGVEVPDGIFVRRKDCDDIEHKLKGLIAKVRRLRGKRVVISGSNLVTAYHATEIEEHRLLMRDRNSRRRRRR